MFRNCGNVQDIQIYGKNKARVPIFYAYVIFDSPEGVEGALNIKVCWLFSICDLEEKFDLNVYFVVVDMEGKSPSDFETQTPWSAYAW